jgi:predicted RNA binding protein YcfA (HicA-like mRNA interferase family)
VTVPGALGDDLHRELLSSIVRQAGLERRRR